MAGTIVNNMTALNEADATGWTCTSSETLYTAFYREATGCLGLKLNASAGYMYVTPSGSPVNMSNMTMHGWCLFYVGRDTYTNGGMSLTVGDGTNTAGFPCAGSDVAGFHATPDGWSCIILSIPDKVDGEAINIAGTTASINDASITQVGYYLAASTAAVGNVDNTFWDIVWAYDHTGYATEITAGTDVSPAGFSDLATYDASTATQRGLGVMSEVASGVFSCTAPVQIGDDGTGSSHFEATNEEIIFEDVGHLNNHKLAVVGNSTGTNNAYFTSFTFRNVHSTLTPTLNFNGGNIDVLEFDGCTFLGIDANFSNSADATGHSVINSTFDGCAQLDPGDVTFTTVNFANTSDANGAILIDADGTTNITGVSFISDGTGHGVYLGTGCPSAITLTNWNFTGYGATGTTDAAIYNDSGGAVSVTISGGDTPTYRNGSGASTTIISGAVTVKVTAVTEAGADIQSAYVHLRASDGTGPFPYQESVTITRSGTTATVAHTGHGMATNDKILLRGITDKTEDNTVHTITVTGVDAYTYTTTDSGSTSYTGTITSTFVALHGLTDVNGEISTSRVYSSNQPVTGWSRKSTSSPYYKEGPINDTISSTGGLDYTAVMVSDE